jgi:hypothetical protein
VAHNQRLSRIYASLIVSRHSAKALAIYREGRNAEQNYLVTYAVLSYYKIVELKHRGKSKARSWFETNYARLKDDRTLRTLNVMAEQSSA